MLIIACSLLAGWIEAVPPWIATWLPLIGLLIGCAALSLVGRLRLAHAVLGSLAIYAATISFLTFVELLWADVMLGPFRLGAIPDAWASNQEEILTWIPQLQILQDPATLARSLIPDPILGDVIYNLVAYAFLALSALVVTSIASLATREARPLTMPLETPSTYPPSSPTGAEAPTPRTASPSAQAISQLRGKVTSQLKSTGQVVPRGQTRCPYCHATVIPGSRFCNACQREF